MKTVKLITLLFLFVAFGLQLQGTVPKERPKIGLVLSGGGAKGFAHVGVLKVLEESGIPVDYIAGTSIGSIIGGLYACGYNAATLETLVKSQDWNNLLSNEYKTEYANPYDRADESRYIVSFPFEQKKLALSNGVLNGQNAMELLSYLTLGFHDVYDFSRLPIPFLCIATDLTNGREVVLDKGFLPKAIRASISVPVAFSSVEIDGRMLVDGGIVNNFPVDRCRQMGADIVIGVDITDSTLNAKDLKEIPDVVSQMITFMGQERNEKNIRNLDIHIRPITKGYSSANFSNDIAEKLIQLGEEAARKMMPSLIHLRDSVGPVPPVPHNLSFPNNNTTLTIDNIEVSGTDRAKIAFYLGQMGIMYDKHVTLQHLRNGISRLYSTGNYEYVNYQLTGSGGRTLKIDVKERPNNKINAGLRYDSYYRSSLLVNVTLRNQNFFGSRLSLDARLAEYPMFSAHYSIDRGWKPGLLSRIMYVSDKLYRYANDKKTAEIEMSLFNLQLASHSFITDATRFSLGASIDSYHTGTVIGDTTGYKIRNKSYFNLIAKIEHNRLDKVYFPRKGANISGGFKLLLNEWSDKPVMIGDFNYKRARSVSDRVTLLYGFDSRLVFGSNESYYHRTYLGGVQVADYFENTIAFNGLERKEISAGSVGVLRLEARLKMWEKLYVSLTGDAGMFSNDNLFITNQETIFGYGLNIAYDSVVGPLVLTMSFSSLDRTILPYLSLGFRF